MDMPFQDGLPDPTVLFPGVETAMSADGASLQLSLSTESGDNARIVTSGLPPPLPGGQTSMTMPFVSMGSSVRPTTPSEDVYIVSGAHMDYDQIDVD